MAFGQTSPIAGRGSGLRPQRLSLSGLGWEGNLPHVLRQALPAQRDRGLGRRVCAGVCAPWPHPKGDGRGSLPACSLGRPPTLGEPPRTRPQGLGVGAARPRGPQTTHLPPRSCRPAARSGVPCLGRTVRLGRTWTCPPKSLGWDQAPGQVPWAARAPLGDGVGPSLQLWPRQLPICSCHRLPTGSPRCSCL